ncbi:Kae1-like domain-containing protein [Romboutsia sp.]|uniref:Kae1-like domain-containing protein n=1 Tax=Romboutsia sp. TaxID=1965302 RepID=UPI003F66EB41
MENNIIIGIDTSCYTTSIAAISLGKKVILNKKVMLEVKENSKGLRQSEGVFQHVNNLGQISNQINELTKEYRVRGICVSTKPRPVDGSYMPVFNVGYNFGKLCASMIQCPIYETTHQENHIEASLFTNDIKNKNKFLSVHMSGGTTEILLVEKNKEELNSNYKIQIVGGSKDISFGQVIDRAGVKLGYKFPAGKYIDAEAITCKKAIRQGLKTSVTDGYMNLSGLENQVNKLIEEESKEYIAKLILDSIVRCMYKSIVHISRNYEVDEVVFAGGVSASKYISRELTLKLSKNKIKGYFTRPEYSTDNAVGCAIIGVNKFLGE